MSDGRASTNVDVIAPVSAIQGHPDDDGTLEPSDLVDLLGAGVVEVLQNDDGTVRVIDGTFTDDVVRDSADAEALNRIAELLGASGGFVQLDAAVRITHQTANSPGGEDLYSTEEFYRLRQTVNGVPVLGSDVILATDVNGTVTGVFSAYNSAVTSVDIAPSDNIDEQSEVKMAQRFSKSAAAQPPDQEALEAFSASLTFESNLVVFDLDPEVPPTLAWRVNVLTTPTPSGGEEQGESEYASGEDSPVVNATYFVYANGANAGDILAVDGGRDAWTSSSVRPEISSQRTDRSTSNAREARLELSDARRNIKTYNTSYPLGVFVNVPGDIVRQTQSGWDPAAISAHANMAVVYDYYRERVPPHLVRRQRCADQDQRALRQVPWDGLAYRNAAWLVLGSRSLSSAPLESSKPASNHCRSRIHPRCHRLRRRSRFLRR